MIILFLLDRVTAPSYADSYLFIIILAYGAMEARLGLALLVSLARKSGRDIVSSLTLRKC